jgi:predicted nucleic acid-binding protein
MTADVRACLDACVLANQGVCDLLLRLSETPRLVSPVFSTSILDEVHTVHLKRLQRPWPLHVAESWQQQVRLHFPESIVEGYEHLEPLLTDIEEGDRHVVATAIRGNAELIVTFNLKHFPSRSLVRWGIKPIHPQEYLCDLYEMCPDLVLRRLYEISRMASRELVVTLRRLHTPVPQFVAAVAQALGLDVSA